jgi:hypothetical protein
VTETAARREADPARRASAMAEARGYLSLAIGLLHPAAPLLVAIGGFSGTGKTTLARALAPDLPPVPGARVLRSDVIRKRLWGVPERHRLPDHAYGEGAARRVYDVLAAEARDILDAGCSVIADAVFSRGRERRDIAAVAAAAGVPFRGLWLTAPVETLVARVDARSGDASDATAAVVKRQVGQGAQDPDWPVVEAGGSPEACRLAAARAIGLDPQAAGLEPDQGARAKRRTS